MDIPYTYIHGDDGDYVEEGFAPDRIDTPSDDFYNINTTNLNRNPQVKSLIPQIVSHFSD